jgi:hypothetical protein
LCPKSNSARTSSRIPRNSARINYFTQLGETGQSGNPDFVVRPSLVASRKVNWLQTPAPAPRGRPGLLQSSIPRATAVPHRVGTWHPVSLKTCRFLASRVSQNVWALSVSLCANHMLMQNSFQTGHIHTRLVEVVDHVSMSC